MAESQKASGKRTIKVPEFLKDQFEHAQARFGKLEGSAEKTLRDLVEKGKASRKDLMARLDKLSKDERIHELIGRLEKLQKTGTVRAGEWKEKAENFRAEALERILELQGKAVKFLGVASREEVEELHRELDRLARKLEKVRQSGGAGKGVKKAEA